MNLSKTWLNTGELDKLGHSNVDLRKGKVIPDGVDEERECVAVLWFGQVDATAFDGVAGEDWLERQSSCAVEVARRKKKLR